MPHYYFHIRDHEKLIIDEDGLDFQDLARATNEAEESGRDMLRDALLAGENVGHQRIEITDQAGTVHGIVHLNLIIQKPRRVD